jgi:hypothetical protein
MWFWLFVGAVALGVLPFIPQPRPAPEPVSWCLNVKRLDVPEMPGSYRLEFRSDFLGAPCRYAKHEAHV